MINNNYQLQIYSERPLVNRSKLSSWYLNDLWERFFDVVFHETSWCFLSVTLNVILWEAAHYSHYAVEIAAFSLQHFNNSRLCFLCTHWFARDFTCGWVKRMFQISLLLHVVIACTLSNISRLFRTVRVWKQLIKDWDPLKPVPSGHQWYCTASCLAADSVNISTVFGYHSRKEYCLFNYC